MRETLKSLVLTALILLSLALSYQLWFHSPALQSERLLQAPYVTPAGTVVDDWRELITPDRLYVHLRGIRYRVTQHVVSRSLLRVLAELGAVVDPGELTPLSAADLDDLLTGRRGHSGVEAVMSTRAPLGFWQQVWRSWERRPGPGDLEAAAVTGPHLERVYLFVTADELVLVVRQEGALAAWRAVLRGSAVHPDAGDLLQYAQGLGTLFNEWPETDDDHLVELPEEFGGLRLAQGLFAPANPEPRGILVMSPEEVDATHLLRSFFIDFALVRTVVSRDVSIHSDGRSSLSWHRNLTMEYQRPAAMGEHLETDALSALREVMAFVNDRGGFPEGVYLSRLDPIVERGGLQVGGRGPVIGYRLAFGLRVGGHTLETTPVLTVDYGAGGISKLWRIYPVFDPLRVAQERAPNPAVTALEVLREIPEEVLPDSARRVEDVRLGYLPVEGPDQEWLYLVWTFTLHNDRRVWVDAWGVYPRAWVETDEGDIRVWTRFPDNGGG